MILSSRTVSVDGILFVPAHSDPSTLTGEEFGRAPPDPARPPGDESDGILKFVDHATTS